METIISARPRLSITRRVGRFFLIRLHGRSTLVIVSLVALVMGIALVTIRNEAALLSYQQTVLQAFQEVEDALSSQVAEELRYKSLTAQLADNRQAVLEAQQRYRRGQEGLLPVLEDQEQLYATQDAQVTSTLTRCLADISLFKALGGNWQEVAL